MTMTDTPNGYRALPWYSDGYRVYDADGIEVANTFTPELALGSAKAVAKDIAEAVNAYYGVGHARIDLLSSEVDRLQSLFAKAQTKANEQARRAEKAEARVRELEKTHAPDTFTAPDGRVFRVGQWVNVHHPSGHRSSGWVVSGPNVHRVDWVAIRAERDPENEWGQPMANLRRVWDGTEEPGVPVGTVLRDSEGDHWEKTARGQWVWVAVPGDFPAPWGQGMRKYGPYVEVLPGDDE